MFADPQSDEAQRAAGGVRHDDRRLRSWPRPTSQLRGPGELFGTRQHGLPPLRIADLVRDTELLDEARRDAQALVAADPGLAQPEHARLRRMTLSRYGKVLELGDVG